MKLAPSRSRSGKLSTSGSRLGSPSRSNTRLGSRSGNRSSLSGSASRRPNSNARSSLGKNSGRVGSSPRSARSQKAASEYRSRLSTRLGKTSAKNARISRPSSNATLSRGTPRVNAARNAGKAVGKTGPRSTARAPKTYSHNGIRPTTTPRKGPRVTAGSTSTNSGSPHHSDNHYPHDGYGGHDYDHDYDDHHNHHHHHHHHHGHGFHFGFHLGLGYFGWYGYRYRPWYGHYFRHSYYYPWYGYAHFPYYWSYHLYPSYRTSYYVDYVDYSDSTYYRDYAGYTSDPYDGYGDSYLSPSVVEATEEAAPFGTNEGLTLAPANSLATPFASNVNTGRTYDDAIQASNRFAKASQFPQAAEAARQAYLRQATAPALQRVSLALLASGDFPMASWAMVQSIGSSQPSLVAYSVLLSDYLGGPEVSRSIRNLEAYLVDNTNDEASNLLLGAMYTMTGRDYAGYMIMNRLQSAGYEVETVKLFSDQARAALGK